MLTPWLNQEKITSAKLNQMMQSVVPIFDVYPEDIIIEAVLPCTSATPDRQKLVYIKRNEQVIAPIPYLYGVEGGDPSSNRSHFADVFDAIHPRLGESLPFRRVHSGITQMRVKCKIEAEILTSGSLVIASSASMKVESLLSIQLWINRVMVGNNSQAANRYGTDGVGITSVDVEHIYSLTSMTDDTPGLLTVTVDTDMDYVLSSGSGFLLLYARIKGLEVFFE